MKSKFLQNSKDMLSRSFNPIKCSKTSLRLAGSRLKLLRNKKEVQVKQMKREIAQLLQSRQDHTARIRVEHVMREEKMMAAYDLLEIYCELIIARLPIIESQKECPIDLKEAIASIVFSSPRCGDVPELLDVRKQFSAKYGKDFITAATELRPMCGVGRLLVEKLSASSPDGPTKIKVLNAIADEHNVKWDHKYFEEKETGGPSPIRNESELHSESPRLEAVDAQAQQDDKLSLGEEKLSSGQASYVTTKTQPEARPPGEKMSQLFQGDGYNGQLDSQKWNMEFKDAASAAQAAAESAERANMAARAAAELSSHGKLSTQYSIEPQKSDGFSLKAEGLEGPPNLNSLKKNSEASANKSSTIHTGLESAEVDGYEPDQVTSSRFEESGDGSEEYSRSPSLKSKASGADDSLYNGFPFADDYIQKDSLKEESEGETNMKKQSETETSNGWQKKAENLGEGMIVKQKSLSISDDVNIFADFENEDPFTSTSAPKKSSHVTDALFFDKSDSEVDDHGPTYDEQDLGYHLGQKSVSVNTDSWSPGSSSSNVVKSASPPLFFSRENAFPENTTLRNVAELDDFAPVTFDDSCGSSDVDMNAHEHYETRSEFQDKTGHEPVGYSEIDSKQMSLSSDEDGNPWKGDQVNIFDADSSSENEQPSQDSQMDIGNESRLDFGKLTGGFRHKGHNHLPFFKNNTRLDVLSVKKEAEIAPTITSSTTLSSSVEHPEIVTKLHHKKSSYLYSESDSDTFEEEEILHKSSPKIKLNLGASSSNFYSDDSDLDEDFPKVSHAKKSHVQSGISRRTKASPSSSGKNSTSLRSEALDSNGIDTKATASETPEANRMSSENYEQPISGVASEKTNSGKASYNTVQEPKILNKSSAPFASETTTSNKISLNKDESPKKASHVHPKLPDYDALVQSLRINNGS